MAMRLGLKQMILNVVEKQPRGYKNTLADIAGYTGENRGSNFKKVLTGDKKEFSDFGKLVDLVQYLFPEDEKELLEDYAKTVNPNWQTARNMLEYLSCNRLLDSMKELIDQMAQSKNDDAKEWADIYSLQYEYQLNYHTLDINKHLKNIRSKRTSNQELDVYLRLMKCYAYYLKDDHKRAYEIAEELEVDIEEIENEYIKNVYSAKLSEVMSYITLWVMNDPETARTHAEKVIDSKIGKTYEAYALYTIGLSYFYTNYDTALSYFNESIECYNSIDRELAAKDVEEYVEKLNVFWQKELSKHEFVSLDNKLMYKVKKGENITVSMEDSKEKLDEAYYYLLKGLNNDDRDSLMESLVVFIDRGDTFWGNLAKIELLRKGENERVIDRLMKINKA
jgi:hypothetical protein